MAGRHNGEVIDVTNPANGDKLGSVRKWALMKPAPLSTPPTAPCPLACAHRQRTRQHSAQLVQFVMEHQDDLARLMTLEQGKPLPKRKAKSATLPLLLSGLPKKQTYLWRHHSRSSGRQTPDCFKQPIGVTAAITPWNFPAAMLPVKPVRRWRQAARWC